MDLQTARLHIWHTAWLLDQGEKCNFESSRAKVVCFSGGGSTGPRPFFTPYAVAKAAVVRMVPRPAPVALRPALLKELVQVAFSQRHKLLRHTLGRWLEQRPDSPAFDVQRRARKAVGNGSAAARAAAADRRVVRAHPAARGAGTRR